MLHGNQIQCFEVNFILNIENLGNLKRCMIVTNKNNIDYQAMVDKWVYKDFILNSKWQKTDNNVFFN